MSMRSKVFALLFLVFLCVWPVSAQTTEFTYQGSLKAGNNPANGPFDFEFALYDAAQGGNQLGVTLSKPNITVTDGIFSVTLDFGNQFSGAARFLELRVRSAGQASFTPLTPRQPVNSAPQSVRSLIATNAQQLNGVAANQFVTTDDPRLSDSRDPTPNSFLYIQNGLTRQAFFNFNVDSGTAVFFDADYFSLKKQKLIHGGELGSIYFGYNTATQINGADFNSFFGEDSGRSLTMGDSNSFFGNSSGKAITLGSFNSFFGASAGAATSTGTNNSYFGYRSGLSGVDGTGNSFFGSGAGAANINGSNNTIIGANADLVGGGLSFATAIGAGSTVSASNSVVLGRAADTVRVPGGLNVTGASNFTGPLVVGGAGTFSGNLNVTGTLTAGTFSVPAANLTGILPVAKGGTGIGASGAAGNFLRSDGVSWVSSALQPADIPSLAGSYIQNGSSPQAGANFNIAGNGTVGGTLSGNVVNAGSQFNIGGNRVLIGSSINLFAGFGAGANATGGSNSFFGVSTGSQTTSGTGNSFFGANAGITNVTGSDNTVIGSGANVGSAGLSNATAIGAGAVVSNSNSVVLGRSADTVRVPGTLNVSGNTIIGGSLSVSGSFSVPATSITGVLGAANGGTGLSSPGTTGSFLKSTGTGWTSATLTSADIPSLAGSYIQNGTAAQTGSFNIAGSGTIGGNLTVNGSITGAFSVPAGSITGVVAAANGGTGLNTPGTSGNFLRSTGGGWSSQALSANDIPSLAGSYIQNSSSPQAGANFNIGGNGTAAGTLSGNVVNAGTEFRINNSRILADSGNNLFVGIGAGSGTTGLRNTIVGSSAGGNTTAGDDNVFVGRNAGLLNGTGSSNTIVGGSANMGSNNLMFATAIGANSVVNTSDTIVLGKAAGTYNTVPRPADRIIIPGTLSVGGTITVGALGTTGGMNNLCLDASNRIAQCSSSARYKYNVNSFNSGLNIVRRLQPVTFNWKSNGASDMGLVAEDVAAVEPLLVNRNANGEVEGVKYDRVGVVLLNAMKEQQAQIESLQKEVETRKASETSLKERLDKQQAEIDAIKKFICSQNPNAEICR